MIKRNEKGQFIKGFIPDTQWMKGRIPWNKGLKNIHLSPKSEFKKGFVPWNKGKSNIYSENHLKIMSKNTRERLLRNHHFKGKKFSEEHKKKLSLAQIGKCGKFSKNWQGGITPINTKIRNSNEYQEWRNAVFIKDDYTCQECGLRGGNLNAHHIKSFSKNPKLRLSLFNGMTLCFDCHKVMRKSNAGSQGVNMGVERLSK